MKIYQDCKEFEAIGCILARDMLNYFRFHGVENPRIGEIYFEGAKHQKPIDTEIAAAIKRAIGMPGPLVPGEEGKDEGG